MTLKQFPISKKKKEKLYENGNYPDVKSAKKIFRFIVNILLFIFNLYYIILFVRNRVDFYLVRDLLNGFFYDYKSFFIVIVVCTFFLLFVFSASLILVDFLLYVFNAIIIRYILIRFNFISFNLFKIDQNLSRLKNELGANITLCIYSTFLLIGSIYIVISAIGNEIPSISTCYTIFVNLISFILITTCLFVAFEFFRVFTKFNRENSMTFKEVKDEFKELEGNQELKYQRQLEYQRLIFANIEERVKKSSIIVLG